MRVYIREKCSHPVGSMDPKCGPLVCRALEQWGSKFFVHHPPPNNFGVSDLSRDICQERSTLWAFDREGGSSYILDLHTWGAASLTHLHCSGSLA